MAKVIQFPMNDEMRGWLFEEAYRIFWEQDDPYGDYDYVDEEEVIIRT